MPLQWQTASFKVCEMPLRVFLLLLLDRTTTTVLVGTQMSTIFCGVTFKYIYLMQTSIFTDFVKIL